MSTFSALLVLAAATLHASWNFAARKSNGNIVVMWLSLILTGLITLPVAAPMAGQSPIAGISWIYVLATGAVHAAYFSLLAMAYQGGELSLVYPIARGTGVSGTAVVIFLLAIEGIEPQAALGISAVCGGIFLTGLGHKSGGRGHSKGKSIALALLVGLTVIGYNLIDKMAVSMVANGAIRPGALHPLVYICAVFLGSAVFMTPYVLLTMRRQAVAGWRAQIMYIGLIGPAALCTYLPILFAYRWEKASSIVAFREFSVVIGSVLGFVFLGEKITIRKTLGICLITAGLVLIKTANGQ